MKKYTFLISLLLLPLMFINGQELNAKVNVNASKVQGGQQLFATLQEQLYTFINERKWSEANFRAAERIECSFTIIVNEAAAPNSYRGELLVQSRRPVYNATYTTPMLNFRDADFAFDYTEYQPLEFNLNNLSGNLTTTIAYYIYLILGLDFDSMSPLGGTPFFKQMMTVASSAQSQNLPGWEFSSTGRTRYTLADTFNNEVFEPYRKMWYEFHRKGLDEMSENIEKSRENVLTSLPVISALYDQRPNSLLISLFGDSKLDELIAIIAGADRDVKDKSYELLRKTYPTRSAELEKLKR